MKKKYLLVIPLVIVIALAGFFVVNYKFHVLGGQGNGTAECTSYLRGNCLYEATFNNATDDLTVYGLGQITGSTMYNVGFAYAPAVARENSQYGPIGATFQASSSLADNILKSGETITITFDSINATAPPAGNGQDGYLWIAYTMTTGGSDCVGAISNLPNCSFFNLGYVTLNT